MNVRVVNPGTPFFGAANPRRRKKSRARAGAMVLVANRKRRRRSSRNALIMPMAASNPLILPNRGRRRHGGRRRRRYSSNPAVFGGGFLGTMLTGVAGGGIGYWSDRLFINKLGRAGTPGADGLAPSTPNGAWIRNAARVVAGGIGAYFFPGNFGAAINGSFSYPVWGAIDEMMTRPSSTAAATSAYLNGTDAYLSDVLDGMV